MRRGVALGERSGLAFRRPTQRLDLAAQPLVDLLEPLTLGPQPLVLRPQPFPLLPQLLLLFAQRGVHVLKPNDAPAQPARASRIPTGLRTSRLPRHKAGRLQPSHPASRTGTRYLNTDGLTGHRSHDLVGVSDQGLGMAFAWVDGRLAAGDGSAMSCPSATGARLSASPAISARAAA